MSAAGTLTLGIAGGGVTLPLLIFSLGLLGVGLGLASAGMQTAAVESVRPNEAGVASGIYSTSRYLGSIAGSSLLAVLLITGAGGLTGFNSVFLLVAIASCAALAASLGLRDWPAEVTSTAGHGA
jgi:DHA2 family methylenomycin A resistance protein-like MFS transporter